MTKPKDPPKSEREQALEAYFRSHYKKAVRLLTPFAEQGDILAQLFLYSIYRYGRGCPVDESRAASWLERVIAQAENGSVEAQWKLYEHYQFDFPVPAAPDENENTRHWLIAAANSGHPEAMFELSMKYRLGSENIHGIEIFEKDIEQADYWLDLAVAHKFPYALTYKAFFYFDETGWPTEKAMALLTEAEALGDFDARVHLSRIRN